MELNWIKVRAKEYRVKYRHYALLFVNVLMLSLLVFTLTYQWTYESYMPKPQDQWASEPRFVYINGVKVDVAQLSNQTYVALLDLDVPPEPTTERTTTTTLRPTTTTLEVTTTTEGTTSTTSSTTTTIADSITNLYPAKIDLKYRECFQNSDCCVHSTGCCPCGLWGGKLDAIRCALIPKFEEAHNCTNIGIYCRAKKTTCNAAAACIEKYVNNQYIGNFCEVTAKW